MKSLEILDLFCGAGGTSTGAIEAAEAAGYRPRLTAINHWPIAVETHTLNHPGSRHLCTGADQVNARELYRGRKLDMFWASPECTFHSNACGGAPINDQSRATAWCVVRFAEALLPPIILVENVPEFAKWGPLIRVRYVDKSGRVKYKWRPDPKRKGEIFMAWVNALKSLGYTVEWKVLCAADYGDPTTRRRLFVQAVHGRRKVVWPEATHGPNLRPFVAAKEIIDWKLPCPSVYDRKKPLSPKTMARIFEGLKRFGLGPMIMSAGGPECPARPVEEPMGTVLTRDHRALAKPFLIPQQSSNGARSVDLPAPTVTTTSRGVGLAQPFLICMEHGGGVRSAERPMPTITCAKGGAIGVAKPFLVELRGTNDQQVKNSARSVEEPVPTITTSGGHLAVATPYLVQVNHGNGKDPNGNARRVRSTDAPLPTVCGERGEWALCEPALLPQQSDGRLRPVSEPAPTVATGGAIALVEPFLVSYYGNGTAMSVADPLDTVTTRDRFALARPVVEYNGERYLLDIGFRMLQAHELALAQGFAPGYVFAGTKTDAVKQIGNAVPRRLARALCAAALSQNPNVAELLDSLE